MAKACVMESTLSGSPVELQNCIESEILPRGS
jgi:hypothetical protein